MSASEIALSSLPLFAVIATITIAKRKVLDGAFAGLAVAILLIVLLPSAKFALTDARTAFLNAAIVGLSALLVIVPGLYLNAILRGQGILARIVDDVSSLSISRDRKILILLLGFAPAVESLTGFGVSMFLTIPILFGIVDSAKASKLALLGMNIMPWGTLALATVVGAALSTGSVRELGTATAMTSFLVYPVIGVLIAVVIGNVRPVGILTSVLLGLGLSALLFVFNKASFVEIAGVLAGLCVTAVAFLILRNRIPSTDRASSPPEFNVVRMLRNLSTYWLVLTIIAVFRIPVVQEVLSSVLVISSGRFHLSVLTSPGIALATAALWRVFQEPIRIDHSIIRSRAMPAVSAILMFALLSQLMMVSGLLGNITSAFSSIRSPVALAWVSPALAMLSGFVTGSNVGGNALLMPIQHDLGTGVGFATLFSALQNSGAGHAVFASPALIVLVSTLVREADPTSKSRDHELARFSLVCLLPIYLAICISAMTIITFKLL